MKIHLAGSCNLADGYLGAAKALERRGHAVSFSPVTAYALDDKKSQVANVIRDIQAAAPDVVLWWRAESLTARELAEIRKTYQAVSVMYSWDPMTLWEQGEEELGKKCASWDIAFTCCKPSMQKYEQYGCRSVYAPPGFDPTIHYPEASPEHECDVSMVLTNLYHGDELTKFPHISRLALLEAIIKSCPELKVRIYGPDFLKKFFPENYAGWAKFNESRKIYFNSKINLCTHLRPDTDMYYNERVAQVLGSQGLLLVDPVVGLEKILEPGKECVVMDGSAEALIRQIRHLVAIHGGEGVEIRKRGHEKAMRCMTWDNWAKTVDEALSGR